jgi:hypothetical protein
MRKNHRYFSVEEKKRSAVKRVTAGEAASTAAPDIGAERDSLCDTASIRMAGRRSCAGLAGRARRRR